MRIRIKRDLIRNEMRMLVHFTFLRGVEVEERVRLYVEKKMDAAGKALGEPKEANVEIDQNKRGEYSVDVSLHSKGETFRASETASSVEEAIDTIERELQEQIRDYKKKTIDLERRRGRSGKKKTAIDESARF